MIQAGSTSQSVEILALDMDGVPATGLTATSPGLALYYHRPGSAAVAITPVALSTVTDPWTAGGIIHRGQGVYRLDLPDAALATGAIRVTVSGLATGYVFRPETYALVAFNPQDAMRLGLTSLPAVTFGALGGLPTLQSVNLVPGSVWAIVGAGQVTAGTMGNIVATSLDAAVSTRLAAAGYTAPPSASTIADAVRDVTGLIGAPAGSLGKVIDTMATGMPTAAGIADAVWDEARAGHVTAGTFGEVLEGSDGTVASATSTTVGLGASAPAIDLTGLSVRIVSGLGAPQERRITAYDTGTKVATISPAWTVTPDVTSKYLIGGPAVDGPVDLTTGAVDAVWSRTVRTVTAPVDLTPGAVTAVWASATRTLTGFGFSVTLGAGSITGTSIATGALTSDKLAIGTTDAGARGLFERLMMLVDAFAPVGTGGVTQPTSGNGNRVVKRADGSTQASYPVTSSDTTQTIGPAA